MSKVRIAALTSFAVLALAAPASAQEPETPFCQPQVPTTAPDLVNCAFDNVVWALNEAEQATRETQADVNEAFGHAQTATNDVLIVVDDAEKAGMSVLCDAASRPPEECPDL